MTEMSCVKCGGRFSGQYSVHAIAMSELSEQPRLIPGPLCPRCRDPHNEDKRQQIANRRSAAISERLGLLTLLGGPELLDNAARAVTAHANWLDLVTHCERGGTPTLATDLEAPPAMSQTEVFAYVACAQLLARCLEARGHKVERRSYR